MADVTKCPVKSKCKRYKLPFVLVSCSFIGWVLGQCVCLFEELGLEDFFWFSLSPDVMVELTRRETRHFVTT